MNKPGLLCITLAIFAILPRSYASLPQPQDRDSLMQLLTPSLPDSMRVDIWSALHFTWQKENPDSTRYYLEKSTRLAEQIDDTGRLIRGYLNLCNFSWERGNYDEAKACLQSVKALLLGNDYPVFQATYSMESAIIRHFTGEMDSSIYFFLKARDAYLVLEDSLGAQKCLGNIGVTYQQLGQNDLALEYFHQTLEYTRGKSEGQYLAMRANILLNITTILIDNEQFDKAIIYSKESLGLAEKQNFHTLAGTNHQNLGVAYGKLQQWDLSHYHYEQALAKGELMQGQAQILLAKLGIGVNQVTQNHPEEAIQILTEVLAQAEGMGNWMRLKDVHVNLSKAYEQTRDFEKALVHYQEFEALKDSLTNADHLDHIAKLEVQYAKKEDQQRIASLTSEGILQQELAEKRARWNWGLAIGILMSVGLLVLLVSQYRKRLTREQELAEQQEQLNHSRFQVRLGELEMKALQAQMNPHFVFNCLNSINHMIIQNRGTEASRYLTRFSKLLRMALEYSDEPTISLKEELEMLDMYLQLESLRFKEQFSYNIHIDDKVNPHDTHLPAMIMQPFVENAIWHGLLPKDGPGHLQIDVSRDAEFLHCTIEDNGIGRSAARRQQSTSIPSHKSKGMDLSKERLALMSRSAHGKIQIEDLLNEQHTGIGTRVDLQIPMAS